ncbi:PREDICTED: uncharacterized protein LOC101302039 [Fragaria vesca subsp. vesca]
MANYLDVSLCERLTVDQGPPIMLPKRLDEAVVQFYTLTNGQTYSSDLPETRGKVCFASLGWLVTLTRVEGQVKLDLFHPSNRAEIKLPDGVTYPLGNIRKFVLSSNPASTLDYTVMFQTFSSLAYCRPGLGQGWTKLMFNGHNYFRDLTYYQGNLYVVEQSGKVSVVCDIEDPERAYLSVVAPEIPDQEKLLGRMKGIKDLYLVESAGSLLVVLCVFLHHQSETTVGFRVYKVPFSNGESWSDSEVKDLGNRALFLSKSSSSFSIEVSGENSGLCKPNCIYFMNSKTTSPYLDLDVGVFNMEDKTIDRDFRNAFKHRTKELREVTELVCNPKIKEPLLWIQPTLCS